MSAFSDMLLIKACDKMFKEVLVLYGIMWAAFSSTVFNSLPMSRSELPRAFSRVPSNLPRESLEGVCPDTAAHQLVLCFYLGTCEKNAVCDSFCSIAFKTVVKLRSKTNWTVNIIKKMHKVTKTILQHFQTAAEKIFVVVEAHISTARVVTPTVCKWLKALLEWVNLLNLDLNDFFFFF